MGKTARLIVQVLVQVKVRPRSVLPGRQRWDIPVMRGRPEVAKLLASRLENASGVLRAQASPVTGTMLVHHAASLDRAELGRVVRRTVTATVGEARARAGRRASRPGPGPGGLGR
ncbi:hypothetical protein [Amycolatopsis alba]|uniref:Uncharacterized protein n=2 Tax=Amycolatopsis TaxID=1813 RepID=A0A229S6Q4_AMYAL|nr:hypothetical protein [Amycolatopsis alba]OXM54570.1 hypothetical protein CFP75_03330 [Amycolatopsis alba DSM 44262]QGJ79678.1 ABC transporter [Amycolatopsis sp. CP2808]